MSVRELRAELADVINAAGMRGQVTFVTSRGRRVAAVVSVADGEQAAAGSTDDEADDRDALMAQSFGVNAVITEDHGGTPSLTMPEVFEDYAAALLRELGGSPERALAAARAVAADAVGSTRYPMLWRQASFAVELCQRAAEIAGQVLPGSYRPGR